MYDAHVLSLSQHLPTMPAWWLSGHDTTWWTRSMIVEREATYRGKAMGETPRPWPRPCRFTRILYAPCTSLEGRTLLPHWIEESFPSPGSCTTQIQRKQGRGRWGREESRRPCFYLQRGCKGGKRTSKTDYQPEISDSNLMSSTPLLISSHPTPLDQKGQHWRPPYT